MQQNIWYLIHVNMVPKGEHAQAKSNLDMIKTWLSLLKAGVRN